MVGFISCHVCAVFERTDETKEHSQETGKGENWSETDKQKFSDSTEFSSRSNTPWTPPFFVYAVNELFPKTVAVKIRKTLICCTFSYPQQQIIKLLIGRCDKLLDDLQSVSERRHVETIGYYVQFVRGPQDTKAPTN